MGDSFASVEKSNPPQELLFSSAIDAIYGTVATPHLWPQALQKIADCFGDVGTVLMYRRDDGSFGTIVSPSLEKAQKDYDEIWWRQDLRSFRGFERGYQFTTDAVTDRHLVSDDEIAAHPIYQQFLVPHGLGWCGALGISPDPRVVVWISVQRNMSKPRFSDNELGLLTSLGRHAENALRLGIRLLNAEAMNLSFGDALSRIQIGAFVVDAKGRVIFTNDSGRALLGAELNVVDGRFQLASKPEAVALDAALSSVLKAQTAEELTGALSPILLRREPSRHPLAIYVLPLKGDIHDPVNAFLLNGRALVLALDGSVDGVPDPALVRDVLGVTLAEARVAALIGSGETPRAAAEKLSISEETARTTLKRVFSKTGVSRQSELAALLAKLILS